ncbi:hypothetical protein DPEC_G00113950 [Dallia pectoralis]|uniref:Uncharacterized protein n=1 Tax=Dallia pectoralis TaxID=75939 RepID=A0ACC2GTU8_DALPE|nr:hypothetical protein DPEC_G00113950 [Dallia pectoralis]
MQTSLTSAAWSDLPGVRCHRVVKSCNATNIHPYLYRWIDDGISSSKQTVHGRGKWRCTQTRVPGSHRTIESHVKRANPNDACSGNRWEFSQTIRLCWAMSSHRHGRLMMGRLKRIVIQRSSK